MSGTPDMAAQIEALRAQIAELAGAVSELRTKLDEDGDQGDGAQEQEPEPDFGKVDLSPLKPFDIQYFSGSKQWKIYLPERCVMANGKAATYLDGTDSDEMAVITPAETLWAHVYPQSYSTYVFTIDDVAPQEDESDDETVHFKVAGFNPGGTQVMVQYASGVVTVGRGEYVCGDDSNISFRRCEDRDDPDRYGKTMIDVYYV